jgi:AraC-like DNA-binding protein
VNSTIIFLISAFLFFLPITTSSQNVNESFVSDKVHDLYNQSTPNAEETYHLGIQILKIAKTAKEFSYGYSLIADGLYKKEDYSRALIFYKKVDSVSKILNDFDRRFMTNLFMTGIYNKVGLLSRANESFSVCKSLKEHSDIPYANYYLLTAETFFLELSYKYAQAIPKREELLSEIEAITNKESSDQSLLVASNAQLAYDYIKCEQLSKAQFYINKADRIIDRQSEINTSIIIAMYKMVKGIYAAETHDFAQASLYFDEALDNARKNNLHIEKMKILEERLNYNLDKTNVRKSLIKELNALRLKRKVEAVKIIEQEQGYKNTIINNKEKQLRLLFLLILLSVIIIFVTLRISANKRKITERKFKQLLEQLQSANVELAKKNEQVRQTIQNPGQTDQPFQINSPDNSPDLPTKKMISEEKENDLLGKLRGFEEGKEFLNSSFSISMMAAQFDTNSKYINYLLQKHRNKLFSDYINSLRISYITKLLYQEPLYLNYKISYLSELCGYSSHSRFTSIFKKETGISPSDFISQLLRKNASTD